MARVECPESVEELHRRESDDVVVGKISRISDPSEARRSSELPEEVSSAPSDGRDGLPSMRNINASDQVGNDQTMREEVRQEEEKTRGHDGDRSKTMIQDEESMARSHGQRRDEDILTLDSTGMMSLREWPLLGSNRGMKDQRKRSSRKP
ncbi:hypothetical protein NL676_012153 [Syzygium grande]|nr:hypothetical protein NL676_012153 [Syzygium grande]